MGSTLILALVAGLLLLKFFVSSSRRQRTAVILDWAFPGLGHLFLGQRTRGLVLGGLVVATFVAGMILADFRNVSPFDRHPIWGVAHAFAGGLAALAALLTRGLHIEHENPYYAIGCLYTGVAALLNVLVMVDAWDLAGRAAPAAEEPGADGVGEARS